MHYILLTCVLIFCVSRVLRESFDNSTHNKVIAAFSFSAIFFLYLFKDNTILPDLEAYFSLFLDSQNVSFDQIGELSKYRWYYKFEFFWCVLTKILSSITQYKESVFIVSGLIVLIGYLTFIVKYSKNVTFSIMLFLVMFFYNSCFVLRQNVAVAICLMSIPFVIQRKLLHFLSLIAIATAIHNSALVFIPIYWIYTRKIDRRFLTFVSVLSIIFGLFSYKLVSLSSFFSSYEIYTQQISEGLSKDNSNFTPLFISIIILLFVLFQTKLEKLNGINLLCTHAIILVYVLNFCRIDMPGVVGRLALYFNATICVLLPNACENIENKYVKLLSYITIFAFYSLLCFKNMKYGFELNF